MKGRRVPPIVIMPPRDDDPSQDVDYRYFLAHPHVREYERDLLPGELLESMPPGTRVVVRRVGQYQRWRGFVPPASEVN